jgi:hypothetical protein
MGRIVSFVETNNKQKIKQPVPTKKYGMVPTIFSANGNDIRSGAYHTILCLFGFVNVFLSSPRRLFTTSIAM